MVRLVRDFLIAAVSVIVAMLLTLLIVDWVLPIDLLSEMLSGAVNLRAMVVLVGVVVLLGVIYTLEAWASRQGRP